MNIAGGLKRSAILRAEGEAEAIKVRRAIKVYRGGVPVHACARLSKG